MKLWCFYFAQSFSPAKECRMYFGDQDAIIELAHKLWSDDPLFCYYEEFKMDHLTNT